MIGRRQRRGVWWWENAGYWPLGRPAAHFPPLLSFVSHSPFTVTALFHSPSPSPFPGCPRREQRRWQEPGRIAAGAQGCHAQHLWLPDFGAADLHFLCPDSRHLRRLLDSVARSTPPRAGREKGRGGGSLAFMLDPPNACPGGTQSVGHIITTTIGWTYHHNNHHSQAILDFFALFSTFNINLDIVSPECEFSTLTWADKWKFKARPFLIT